MIDRFKMSEPAMEEYGVNINRHGVFSSLLAARNAEATPSHNRFNRNIFEVKNDLFYILDVFTGNVIVTRASSFIHATVPQRCQVYVPEGNCMRSVCSYVSLLRVSNNNETVILVHTHTLYIVTLPYVWTCTVLPDHASTYTCAPVKIYQPQQNHLSFCNNIVLQVRWHPRLMSMFLALYDDNCLRLIDAKENTLINVVTLYDSPRKETTCSNFIDFDFPTSNTLATFLVKARKLVSPAFLLKSNGEVHFLVINEGWPPERPQPVPTPDVIPPISEIGSFCSITVLQTHPPFIALVTTSGILFHAVIVTNGTKNIVHILESYKVDVSTQPTTGPHNMFFMIKDPTQTNRYFGLHDLGIFSVVIHLAPIYEEFVLLYGKTPDDMERFKNIGREAFTLVKPLLTTCVQGLSAPRPLYGLGLITNKMRLVYLIALEADLEVFALHVGKMPACLRLPNIFPARDDDPMVDYTLKVRTFLAEVDLQHTFLRLGRPDYACTPESTDQFSQKIFQALQEDSAARYKALHDIITEGVEHIPLRFDELRDNVAKITKIKVEYQRKAESVAELYEELIERDNDLYKRLDSVSKITWINALSMDDERMVDDVQDLQACADLFNEKLSKVQRMITYAYEETQEQEKKRTQVGSRLTLFKICQLNKLLVGMQECISSIKIRVSKLKEKIIEELKMMEVLTYHMNNLKLE